MLGKLHLSVTVKGSFKARECKGQKLYVFLSSMAAILSAEAAGFFVIPFLGSTHCKIKLQSDLTIIKCPALTRSVYKYYPQQVVLL